MANRKTTLLLRRSNVLGKIPDLSGLTIGELALNTADAKLYTLYTNGTSGVTEVKEIGWDKLPITGGTITSGLTVNNGLTSNIFYSTYIYDKNNSLGTNGQVLTTTPTGVLWSDVSGTSSSSSSCNIDTTTTTGLEYKKITTISGFTQGTYLIKSYLTSYSGDSNYGFWERTIGIITNGNTPTITQTTEDFDNYIIGFAPSQIVYTPNTGNTIDVYVSGLTGGDFNWTSIYEIKGQDCGGTSGTFTGNTSADCISDIFVRNIHSCSPLHINPNDEGNIYFGSTSGITLDLSNTTLNVSGSISGNTFYGFGSGITNIPTSSIINLDSQLSSKVNSSLFISHTGDTANPHKTTLGNLFGGSAHTHTISEINGLSDSLNNKFDKTGGTVDGNVVVTGNVTILGTATTINTETLSVKDNIITLNSNYSAGTPFVGSSGIEVLRGSATTSTILWDESLGYWVGGLSGSTKKILLTGDVTDVFVTGGTYSASSSTIIFTNNTGGTFNVTGVTATGGGTFTGGTVTGSTSFTNGLTSNTISATTYFNLPTDIRVTGGTYSGSVNTIIFTNNTGGTFNVTGITSSSTFTGGTVTGATSFTNGLTANTFSSSTFNSPITNTQIIYSNSGTLTGSTGLTWVNSATTLTINGTLEATSKSFSIPHPTKEGKKLVYGSLEGPENGVYHRGKLYNEDTIILPEYWYKLVDKDTVTVQLTSIGKHQNLFVKEVFEDKVIVGIEGGLFTNKTINCYYVVYGERKDINKLEVER